MAATSAVPPLLDDEFTGLCDDLKDVHTGIDLIRAGAVLIASDAAEGRLTRDETQTLLATLMGSADGTDILALLTATTARLMRADTNPCLRELDPDTIANLNRRAEGVERDTADYAPRDYPADACALISPNTALEGS